MGTAGTSKHSFALTSLCRFLSVAVLTQAWPTLGLDAASADQLAASVISQLGRAKGIVSVPNCGNGQLARAFLAGSGMKVHATDPSQANVDATRQLIDPLGVLGLRCSIEKEPLSVMPYVNRFVDCIVITNLTDAALSTLSYAEIQRVLAPTGLAFVGRATSEGAGITQAALQSWINAASKTRSTATVSTTGGTWAVITGLELSGTDVWPKHTYDGSNSNYSKDSVAEFPWLPQAKFKPYLQATYQRPNGGGTTVTSGGRVYEVAPDIGTEGVWGTVPPNMLRAYSIYNGEFLWSRNVTNDGLGDLTQDPMRAYGRDLYLMRSSGGILQLNGITGAEIGTVASVPSAPQSPLARPTNNDQGCGPYHSSIWYNFNGTGNINWDFRLAKARGGHYYKPPCGVVGTIVSNGMMVHMRSSCFCGSSRYSGCNIDGPAGSFQFDRDAAADGSDRIERGPAYGAVTPTVVPDAQDWPTHRANISRTGSTGVSVPTTAGTVHLIYNWRPAVNYTTQASTLMFDSRPEQEPTPPAVVGGYTFIGGTDGYVRCIDNTTGAQAWSYLTGGRICATPTVASGCVYVGSMDGYAYCIEAHTGRLVWRFRAAPADMRMNLYSYLSSVWPVLTGVLVDASGNAYFGAGMQSEYGTHVYCVNASTGALKWQNNKSATVLNPQERLGVTPSGYMTIFRNRLIMASSVPGNASYSLATGVLDSTVREWHTFNAQSCNYCENLARNGYPSNDANRGREVGVVGSEFLMRGGKYVFLDHTFHQSLGYIEAENGFQPFDANGMPLHPYIKITNSILVTPAWDGQNLYQPMTGDHNLRGYALSDLSTVLRSKMSGGTYSWGANDVADYENGNSNAWLPTPTITVATAHFAAIVLAPNALVGTYAKTDPQIPESAVWYVGALNRATGASLWEVALPDVGTGLKGEPLAQGLAIDHSGNVIVTLQNGNVLCYGTGTAVSVDLTPPPPSPAGEGARLTLRHTAVPSASAPQAVSTPTPSARGDLTPGTPSPTGEGAVQLVSTQAPQYEPWRDRSDVVTGVKGEPVHSLSPVQRVDKASYKPRDMVWHPQRECLPVASVKASSSARGCNPASTIDRKLTSRWTPALGGMQAITYDLGAAREVDAVSLVWYGSKACLTTFAIEVSLDGAQFSRVDAGGLTGRRTHTMLRSFVPVEARHVRVALDAPQAATAPSLYEVGVHEATGERQALR